MAAQVQRAIPVRSHFLGSRGRNVALIQYLIGPMSGKTVTRADLYQAIYQKVGLSRTQSATLVELVLKEITDCLERGETVKLSSIGLFEVRQKGQRLGRNPRTGKEVTISPRRVVVFKPSAVLKQRIYVAVNELEPDRRLASALRIVIVAVAVAAMGAGARQPDSG